MLSIGQEVVSVYAQKKSVKSPSRSNNSKLRLGKRKREMSSVKRDSVTLVECCESPRAESNNNDVPASPCGDNSNRRKSKQQRLTNGKIETPDSLPDNKRLSSVSTASTVSIGSGVRDTKLYCYCQKPSSKDLIGCDHCPQWYHPTCLQLNDQTLNIILKLPSWRCPECENKVRKAQKKHQQINLPIPQSTKFCEVKTTRLESWSVAEYTQCGWVPVSDTRWVPLQTTDQGTGDIRKNSRRRHRRSVVPFDPVQYDHISRLSRNKSQDKRKSLDSSLASSSIHPLNTDQCKTPHKISSKQSSTASVEILSSYGNTGTIEDDVKNKHLKVNVSAHSVLMKNVFKLIDENLEYIKSQDKMRIILDGIDSFTVLNLLQLLYSG